MDGLNRAAVCFWKSTRSPTGREPHGDGDPIVVRGRESWPHGEAGQVDRNDKEPGRRDVKSRPPENPATGEPCAWKSCPHGSGRGGWKRARSRLAVTADANGRVNELRRKPSTSPAAYSTEPEYPYRRKHGLEMMIDIQCSLNDRRVDRPPAQHAPWELGCDQHPQGYEMGT